jgi:hypothetical protein
MATITQFDYVPVLKWRQGEYQALLKLRTTQKDRIVPLLEITPPEFDFETGKPAKSLDDHLRKFGPRLETKWGTRLALVDAGLIDPAARLIGGRHPLIGLFADARARGGRIVPVTALDRDSAYQQAVKDIHAIDEQGACLRCSLDEAASEDFDVNVADLCDQLGIEIEDMDLVLDLRAANFTPLDGLATLIHTTMLDATSFAAARSLTIVSSAFPGSMANVTGPMQIWPRLEWSLYKKLIDEASEGSRLPAFGDYVISPPDLVTGDMRILKPSASIRYAIDDAWIIIKGPNVRDNGYGQYKGHCNSVVNATGYLGAAFSAGSDYVKKCGAGTANTGNLTTWRWVGTNHHLAKVVHDLSTFHGS